MDPVADRLRRLLTEGEARLLVADDEPGDYLDAIRKAWNGPFRHCTSTGDLSTAMAAHKPDIAFVYKMPDLNPRTGRVLFEAPRPHWVQFATTGLDHVADWRGTGVTVTNGAGILSPNNAEYTLGVMLAANLGLQTYFEQQQRAEWRIHPRRGLAGQTLLVVGVGQIGGRVATLAQAFGMHVVGVRASGKPHPALDAAITLDQLAANIVTADFVVLSVPLLAETRGLFDAAMLARMKPTAVLINLSRGFIVDETALAAALEAGKLKAAASDVYDEEPLPKSSPLWRTRNMMITPHMSGWVADWRDRHAAAFIENLRRARAGETLVNIVDPEKRY